MQPRSLPGLDLAAGRARSVFQRDELGVVCMFEQDLAHPALRGVRKRFALDVVCLGSECSQHLLPQLRRARRRIGVVRHLDAVAVALRFVQLRSIVSEASKVLFSITPFGA